MKHSIDSGVALSDAPSGFRQLLGYRVSEWADGAATVVLMIGPRHLNRSNIVHGGVVATLIDTAGAYCGTYCSQPGNVRRTISVALSSRFLSTLDVGMIAARARVRQYTSDGFIADVEVFDQNDKLVATGEGTYRYMPGSERTEGTPVQKIGEKRSTSLG
jgi:uncharacterized protein (TIGR00369 family)